MRSRRSHRLLAGLRQGSSTATSGRIAVFAPSPILTVTIERGADRPEVHLHPGGQGFWVARMAANLGAEVILCCALAGEPGRVLAGLIEAEPLVLRGADGGTSNGVYVHDRRSGDRVEIVSVESYPLTRHEADELYGITLGAALDSDVTLITGSQPHDVLEADLYRRLARDLRTNAKRVLADLTGPPLHAVLRGGVELLKLSSEELVDEGFAAGHQLSEIVSATSWLHEAGARNVLISRSAEPAILLEHGAQPTLIELVTSTFEPLDHRGAGDSMFAATAGARSWHDPQASGTARYGRRRAERHQTRSRNGHPARDRTACRARGDRVSRSRPDQDLSDRGVCH
jgi:1-phosphofructokinase